MGFRRADVKNTGSLDFDEFRAALGLTSSSKPMTDDECAELYALFDEDGTGVITTPNLVHVLGLLGAKFSTEDAAKLIKVLDTDNNGVVDYDEFRSFFLHH